MALRPNTRESVSAIPVLRGGLTLAITLLASAVVLAGCGEGTSASEPTAEASSTTDQLAAPSQTTETTVMTLENASVSASKPSWPWPGGSWYLSCEHEILEMTSGTHYPIKMTALCRAKNGVYNWSSITKAQCPRWCAWNNNGVLTCGNC